MKPPCLKVDSLLPQPATCQEYRTGDLFGILFFGSFHSIFWLPLIHPCWVKFSIWPSVWLIRTVRTSNLLLLFPTQFTCVLLLTASVNLHFSNFILKLTCPKWSSRRQKRALRALDPTGLWFLVDVSRRHMLGLNSGPLWQSSPQHLILKGFLSPSHCGISTQVSGFGVSTVADAQCLTSVCKPRLSMLSLEGSSKPSPLKPVFI